MGIFKEYLYVDSNGDLHLSKVARQLVHVEGQGWLKVELIDSWETTYYPLGRAKPSLTYRVRGRIRQEAIVILGALFTLVMFGLASLAMYFITLNSN